MSEQIGEKTEQPTPRKLEDAVKRGQIPRSAEVQTVFVLFGALAGLTFAGREIWQQFTRITAYSLGHLQDAAISASALQGYGVAGVFFLLKCAGPVLLGTALGGLIAGAIQNRFQTAPEALGFHWDRVNPVEGAGRLFSARTAVPALIAVAKLVLIVTLTWSVIRDILGDPIFYTPVSVGQIAEFMASSTLKIVWRVALVLTAIAAVDYGYQFWQNNQDLMMTKEEVKEEMKNSEGNPQIKAARRRRRATSKAKALAEVPNADVVVTNPTHIAIALRYNRKTMRAPKIVAKGIRLNAQKIREIAQQHQVPIMENKPLARMLFKHGRVGSEVPATLYAAVAEVLAWVYRTNRYRYYAELNQV